MARPRGMGRPIILASQEAEAEGPQGCGLPELQTVHLNPAGQLGSMFQNNSNKTQKKRAEDSSLAEACA